MDDFFQSVASVGSADGDGVPPPVTSPAASELSGGGAEAPKPLDSSIVIVGGQQMPRKRGRPRKEAAVGVEIHPAVPAVPSIADVRPSTEAAPPAAAVPLPAASVPSPAPIPVAPAAEPVPVASPPVPAAKPVPLWSQRFLFRRG